MRGLILGASVVALSLLQTPTARAFQLGNQRTPSSQSIAINGNVYYSDTGQPAANITLELFVSGGEMIAQRTTSGAGAFEFRRLSRGTYLLKIDTQDYEPVSFSVALEVSAVKGLTIYLQPIAKSQSSPGGALIGAHELSMPQKARDLASSGKKKLYETKDFQGALEDLQQAVAKATDYYEAYYEIGVVYLSIGKPEESEKNFRKSIEISGDKYGESDIGLGTLMLNRGDSTNGEKAIRRGLELTPNSWLGHYELGRALLNQNRIVDAQKAAEQARSLSPNSAIVYRLLSNIHLSEKNYSALLEDLDAYIKIDPDSPAGARAKEMRAQVAQKIGRVDGVQAANPKP
jgi:tetratricopeptide (TPR) repeat protein